jgi:transposase-like protein
MNDKRKVSRRRIRGGFSPEDRKRLIADYNASGLTRSAFCKLEGIHPVTLSKWMRDASAACEDQGVVEQAKSLASFVETSVPMLSSASLEVDLPNGVRIRVRTTHDVSDTAALIRAMAAPLRADTAC